MVPNFSAEESIRITAGTAEAMRSFYDDQHALGPDASEPQQLRIARKALQTIWEALGLCGSVSTIAPPQVFGQDTNLSLAIWSTAQPAIQLDRCSSPVNSLLRKTFNC